MFVVLISTCFPILKQNPIFTLKFGCHPPKGVTRCGPHQPHPPRNATAGVMPDSGRQTRVAILNSTRHRNGSQCSSCSTGVMWSYHRAPDTRRAAAFWTDCSRLIRPSANSCGVNNSTRSPAVARMADRTAPQQTIYAKAVVHSCNSCRFLVIGIARFTRIDPKCNQVVPWSLHTFPANFMQIGPAVSPQYKTSQTDRQTDRRHSVPQARRYSTVGQKQYDPDTMA